MPKPQLPRLDSPPQRILIVRLSAIGDVILTLPLIKSIKFQYPDAQIGWLVEAASAPLLDNHPELHTVHICHRKAWLKRLKHPTEWLSVIREFRIFCQGVRSEQYDVVIDAQGLLKSAIWGWLAKIPIRIGYTPCRENAHWFYTHPVQRLYAEKDPAISLLTHMATLVKAIGCQHTHAQYPLAIVTPETRSRLCQLLPQLNAPIRPPILVFAPFSSLSVKDWPLDHWQTLIRYLLDHTDSLLLFIGLKEDQTQLTPMLAKFEQHPNVGQLINLLGQTDLKLLQALFEQTDLMIGSDSGATHLAGAVNRAQILALFGPTSPLRTLPPGQRNTPLVTWQILSCQPCYQKSCTIKTHDCMTGISPKEVFQHVMQALKLPIPDTLKPASEQASAPEVQDPVVAYVDPNY